MSDEYVLLDDIDTDDTIWVPLSISDIANLLTNDVETFDNGKRPDGGWTIEPAVDDVLGHISTLVNDWASDKRWDDESGLHDRMVALLRGVATIQKRVQS